MYVSRYHSVYCTDSVDLQGITDLINNCQRLTHLSLTGVEAFYRRKDYTKFCRSPPKGMSAINVRS